MMGTQEKLCHVPLARGCDRFGRHSELKHVLLEMQMRPNQSCGMSVETIDEMKKEYICMCMNTDKC